MATVSIQVVAGAETVTRTRTVSGADLLRFAAALRKRYGISDTPTDAEVIGQWADRVFDEARALTRQVEQNAAAAAVADIGLTP